MKNESVIYFGKCIFGLFFVFGSICLLGNLLTKNDEFAIAGFFLLIYGTVVNLALVFALLVYGIVKKNQLKYCIQSVGIICVNIPVAILYAFIGISFNSI